MPLSDRTRDPAEAGAVPAPRIGRLWPIMIVLAAAIVFMLFWQSTLVTALAMAAATLLAGGTLLTVFFGTAWITQLRHRLGRIYR
jgi:uncharacterized integral membrane protein